MIKVEDHQASERMIYSLTNRVMRRLRTIPHVVLSREDVEQELWCAWCLARDAFDPTQGVPWAAFLQIGMLRHINRVIEKQLERFEEQTFALSLDAPTDVDEGTTLSEAIPSSDPLPCEIAERQSNYHHALRMLSGRARTYVSILHEQPEILLNEVLVAQDKAEFAKKIGAPFNTPRRITSAMIFDLMGSSRAERHKIKKEVEQLGMRISR